MCKTGSDLGLGLSCLVMRAAGRQEADTGVVLTLCRQRLGQLLEELASEALVVTRQPCRTWSSRISGISSSEQSACAASQGAGHPAAIGWRERFVDRVEIGISELDAVVAELQRSEEEDLTFMFNARMPQLTDDVLALVVRTDNLDQHTISIERDSMVGRPP